MMNKVDYFPSTNFPESDQHNGPFYQPITTISQATSMENDDFLPKDLFDVHPSEFNQYIGKSVSEIPNTMDYLPSITLSEPEQGYDQQNQLSIPTLAVPRSGMATGTTSVPAVPVSGVATGTTSIPAVPVSGMATGTNSILPCDLSWKAWKDGSKGAPCVLPSGEILPETILRTNSILMVAGITKDNKLFYINKTSKVFNLVDTLIETPKAILMAQNVTKKQIYVIMNNNQIYYYFGGGRWALNRNEFVGFPNAEYTAKGKGDSKLFAIVPSDDGNSKEIKRLDMYGNNNGKWVDVKNFDCF